MRPLLLGTVVSIALLAGCSYQPARFEPARVHAEPLVEIDDGGHRHYDRRDDRGRDYRQRHYDRHDGRSYRDDHRYREDHRGGFCPPGQAKKGRC